MMELPSFQVARSEQKNVQILTPSGRITLGQTVRDLRQAFDQVAEQGHRVVVLDMTEVAYLDSAGLGTIVTGLNLFRKNGGNLLLCAVQPRVYQLLELTNLTGVIQVFPNLEEAIQAGTASTEPQAKAV